MRNFDYCNKTKIIFGRGTEERAGSETALHSKRILLHHSGNSTVSLGIIDRVKESLKKAGVDWVELTGVQPNPVLSLVKKGVQIVKDEKLDFILAAGGGSAIDSAKAIAVGAVNDGELWDFFDMKRTTDKALGIGTVLTIPAAGSESSTSCVITNEEGPWKKGVHLSCIRPVFSIMNPELTYSLSPYQTACGIVDMLAHIMERYFTKESHVELTDQLCEGTMRTIIGNARRLFSGEENNYDIRAEIMWAGTLAHNGLLDTGRIGDWATHALDHELTALFGIPHGAGLAIIFPAWMKYNIKEDTHRFARFAKTVWGIQGEFYDYDHSALEGLIHVESIDYLNIAREGIKHMESFFRSMEMPTRFSHANIDPSRIDEMAKRVVRYGPIGNYRKLHEEDAAAIYRLAAE